MSDPHNPFYARAYYDYERARRRQRFIDVAVKVGLLGALSVAVGGILIFVTGLK